MDSSIPVGDLCALLPTEIRLKYFTIHSYVFQSWTLSLENSNFHKQVNSREIEERRRRTEWDPLGHQIPHSRVGRRPWGKCFVQNS